MLLCAIDDIPPGMIIGAAVLHPGSPDVELLKPGVALDAGLLSRLRQMGVTQLWVESDITGDLAPATGAELTRIKREMLTNLKTDLSTLSRETMGVGQYQRYRQIMMNLVCELIGSGKYAGLADAVGSQSHVAGRHVNHLAGVLRSVFQHESSVDLDTNPLEAASFDP